MRKYHPIAVACSDIHLSARPPVCRAGEPDWMGVQRRVLMEINETASTVFREVHCDVPVLCAGDIFDRAKSTPSVERLAMEHMTHPEHPEWITIPGQHDLPNHDFDRMNEASYGVLIMGQDIVEKPSFHSDWFSLYPFPWGSELSPLMSTGKKVKDRPPKVALCHQMVWQGNPPYPGAPAEGEVKRVRKQLQGFDLAIFGDNHDPFLDDSASPIILNCGSVMRRTIAQRDHEPSVWVISYNGTDLKVERIRLDTSRDVFSEEHAESARAKDERISAFVESLQANVDIDLSFEENLRRYCEANEVGDDTRQLILEEME